MDRLETNIIPAVGIVGIHYPNDRQPHGVILGIDTDTPSPTGYFALEAIEDGQVVLPNIINVTNAKDNAILALNDGLLRTHQDAIYLNLQGSPATLFILKRPLAINELPNRDNAIFSFALQESGHYVIQCQAGQYSVTFSKNVHGEKI